MKIFFMSTDIRQGTGYARVANKIANYLVTIPNVELVYFSLHSSDNLQIKDRFVDPRIKCYYTRGYGENLINSSLAFQKPDVLLIYNDMLTIKKILDHIPTELMPPIKILYLDIFYPWQNIDVYTYIKNANFTHIWTFTEFWKNHLIDDIGFDANIIDVLPHGVDFERFVDIPQGEAKEMAGFKPDDFLIINMNRNSIRKLWSVTIMAFIELLKRQNMNPKLKLYCGCDMGNFGDTRFRSIIQAECTRLKLDLDRVVREHIFFSVNPQLLTDEQVNILYNAADVGMNTCSGEGFGLTTLEHSYFNRPQVVTAVPALKETLGQYGHFIEPKVTMHLSDNVDHIGHLMYCDPMDVADALEYYFNNPSDRPSSRDHVKERYSWENAYKVLDKYFRNGSVPATE